VIPLKHRVSKVRVVWSIVVLYGWPRTLSAEAGTFTTSLTDTIYNRIQATVLEDLNFYEVMEVMSK
jgi:hypothetical protein